MHCTVRCATMLLCTALGVRRLVRASVYDGKVLGHGSARWGAAVFQPKPRTARGHVPRATLEPDNRAAQLFILYFFAARRCCTCVCGGSSPRPSRSWVRAAFPRAVRPPLVVPVAVEQARLADESLGRPGPCLESALDPPPGSLARWRASVCGA